MPFSTSDWCRLVRSTQPPMPKPERSRGQSSSTRIRLRLGRAQQVGRGVLEAWVRSSRWTPEQRRRETPSAGARAVSRGSTALTWLRLSPVFTTRSGFSAASDSEPFRLGVLARDKVDIAQVQDPERVLARRQDGQRFFPQDKLVLLPQAVARGGEAQRSSCCGSNGKAAPDVSGAACQSSDVSSLSAIPLVAVVVPVAVPVLPALEPCCRRGDGRVARGLRVVRTGRAAGLGVPLTRLDGGAGNGSVP